jgi:Fur family ferric uptake transcriptional regulator
MERMTKQKKAVWQALEEAGGPATPADLLLLAQKEVPRIGIATVYRVLKHLIQDGKVALVEIPGDSPRYEIERHHHHHHFLCRSCDKVYELEGCIEGIGRLAPPKFKVEQHEIVLYGVCARCGRK